MKQQISILRKSAFLVCMALAFSCSVKEFDGPGPGTIVRAETAGTRVILGDRDGSKYPIWWQAGDRINVNGFSSDALPEGYSPSSSAAFTFSESLETPYHALYPASALETYTAGSATINLPARQNYVAGSFDPAAALMIATAQAGSGVHFATPMCFLRLTVNQGSHPSHNIVKVMLRSGGGEKLSGRFTTDYAAIAETSSGADSVALDIAGGLVPGGNVLIAYPARTYASGLRLVITDSEGHAMSIRSNAAHNAEPGHIYKTSVVFDPAGEEGGFTIPELGNEDLDIEWTVDPARGPLDGHTWQILFIGNSLTLDGTHFLPQLLNAAGVTNVELTRTFHGGQTIKGYNDNYNNSTHNSIVTWKPGQPRWQGEEVANRSVRDAVLLHRYDIVCIQDYPGNSVFWQWDATESSAVLGLVMKIKADQGYPGPEFVFHLPHLLPYAYPARISLSVR